MIDIERLDRELELALTPDLRAQLKPLLTSPEPQGLAAEPPLVAETPPVADPPPPPTRLQAPVPTAERRRASTRDVPPAPPAPATETHRAPNAHVPPAPADLHPAAPAASPSRAPVAVAAAEARFAPAPSVRPLRRVVRQPVLAVSPPPVETGGSELSYHARLVEESLQKGGIPEVDRHIAAHAALAEEAGTAEDRRDAASWATMRALLDGRHADARSGAERVLSLGREAGAADAEARYRAQQFWIVLQWGDDDERYELLDYCRQQAYWHGDLTWRSALTLLLARTGRTEEAEREFEFTAESGLRLRATDPSALDITTNLAEVAALLGNTRRASTLNRVVSWPATGLVVVGRAAVCKGSVARYRALLAATTGRWPQADADFEMAVEAHRRMHAQPLLARTLEEWGLGLSGRNDPRAYSCLEESTELTGRLQLVELVPGG